MHPYVKLTAPQELSSSIIENESGQKILLIWKEPANIAGKKGTTYNLALRNTQSGKWLYNPMSVIGGEKDGWRKINRLGNMYLNKSVELNLPVGQYEWTVQAVDAARFGSCALVFARARCVADTGGGARGFACKAAGHDTGSARGLVVRTEFLSARRYFKNIMMPAAVATNTISMKCMPPKNRNFTVVFKPDCR